MTVLSAGRVGLCTPHFPASGTEIFPLLGLGTASTSGDSASSTGDRIPSPGMRGVRMM